MKMTRALCGDNVGIGELAALTGVRVPTIRFYERIGLLPVPRRTKGGQRRYDVSSAHRVLFVRHARNLGFAVGDIRELLGLAVQREASSAGVGAVARRYVIDIDRKIAALERMSTELERLREACEGGTIRRCRIVDTLGEHSARAQVRPGGTRGSRRSK